MTIQRNNGPHRPNTNTTVPGSENTKRRVTINPPSRFHNTTDTNKIQRNFIRNTNPNKKTLGASYQFSKFNRSKGGTIPRSLSAPSLVEKFTSKNKHTITPPKDGDIRIIPLGGVEEIGKNMTAIEIGNDIIVIDAGMQFKTEDTPGIDYIIPNTTYLEERKDKIRAMIVTHGHLDHIGGVPLVMNRIGNPSLYSRNLSILMMRKRQTEFPHLPALNAITVEKNETIMCGKIKVRFFGVTHTIPDSMGIIIKTPY